MAINALPTIPPTLARGAPSIRTSPSLGLAIASVLFMAACGSLDPEITVSGEIADDVIRLDQSTAPQSVWVELENVGNSSCELMAVRAYEPADRIPVANGRVDLEPMEAYVEVGGQPVGQEGTIAVVQPGESARMQIAITGTPVDWERLILCNAPGDYERGRYALLAFDR